MDQSYFYFKKLNTVKLKIITALHSLKNDMREE